MQQPFLAHFRAEVNILWLVCAFRICQARCCSEAELQNAA